MKYEKIAEYSNAKFRRKQLRLHRMPLFLSGIVSLLLFLGRSIGDSVFSCLKCECVHLRHFASRAQALADVFAYIAKVLHDSAVEPALAGRDIGDVADPCGVSLRRQQDQALKRKLLGLHQRYPALGLDSLYHLIRPELSCSRKRIRRLQPAAQRVDADAQLRRHLSAGPPLLRAYRKIRGQPGTFPAFSRYPSISVLTSGTSIVAILTIRGLAYRRALRYNIEGEDIDEQEIPV